MSEPEMIENGGMISVSWPEIDLGTLDWWPMDRYSPEATVLPIVQDADNKTWLAKQDEHGEWREFIDGQLTRKLVPIWWAVPTSEMVQALAFG